MVANMFAEELIRDLPKGLIQWYPFSKGKDALVVSEEMQKGEVFQEVLFEMGLQVDICSVMNLTDRLYDFVVVDSTIEQQKDMVLALTKIRERCKKDARILLAVNNRWGYRYFCGDRDPYTGRNIDSLDNYRRVYSKKEDAFYGRMYDKAQLRGILEEAGFMNKQFYAVYSELMNPTHLFAEDYEINEDLLNRICPRYLHPDSVYLEEETLYQTAINNRMFHTLANAFLVECTTSEPLCDIAHITVSLERGRESAMITTIHRSGVVMKRAAYPEGINRVVEIHHNLQELRNHGIKVIETSIVENALEMPYINQQVAQLYLKELLIADKQAFLHAFDHLRDLVLQSSKIVKEDQGDGKGALLDRAYLDMVPLNSFYIDGEFVFFDQEFAYDHYPANVVIYRLICTFFAGNPELKKYITVEELLERYDLNRNLQEWKTMEASFIKTLRNSTELRIYNEKGSLNPAVVHANRQRMNFSETEYSKLFTDIFKNAKCKKLIVFGSGDFANRFLGMYSKEYEVYAVIDNEKEKWGKMLAGIIIQSPQILKNLDLVGVKIMICIKNYISVLRQLEMMGVTDCSIFDPNKAYRRITSVVDDVKSNSSKINSVKPYHIGYVAGTFDMFHVGHVNLLRNAKEMCDYLIVGVIADESVYEQKEKYPIIPLEDRVEIVRSCRYADQVEALSVDYNGIRDAYRMFQFDCLFSGDDHKDEMSWKIDKAYLERFGADIVFFPYTEKISSSKLREIIPIK